MDSRNKPAINLYLYQKKLMLDMSRFICDIQARQTGKSFGWAAKIVLESREVEKNKWVTISSGERQVKEFMEKVELHAKITEKVIEWHEERYAFQNDDGYREEYKIMECTLRNGSKIIGVPANPDTARGYSANVFMDEYSVHKNSREMWAAVFPIVTRGGFKLGVAFTPKGKQNKAYEISQNPRFSQHRVDIYEAVKQGCPLNIEELKAGLSDPDLWAQEYEIKFIDEATAFITYDMINEVESDMAGRPELYGGGDVYVGMDIGRRRDLTVITPLELVGDVLWPREIIEMKQAKFAEQDAELERVFRQYKVRRICIDQTGMGEKPVEDAQKKYGKLTVEGVLFNAGVKLDMANATRKKFQDRQIRLPIDRHLRDDIHSVKKLSTSAGNIRFDAERSGDGHADRFWSLALAIHAAGSPAQPVTYETVNSRRAKFPAGAW